MTESSKSVGITCCIVYVARYLVSCVVPEAFGHIRNVFRTRDPNFGWIFGCDSVEGSGKQLNVRK